MNRCAHATHSGGEIDADNDTLRVSVSHGIGDRVLRSLAQVLEYRVSKRPFDMIFIASATGERYVLWVP
jgi:hypothetical protein